MKKEIVSVAKEPQDIPKILEAISKYYDVYWLEIDKPSKSRRFSISRFLNSDFAVVVFFGAEGKLIPKIVPYENRRIFCSYPAKAKESLFFAVACSDKEEAERVLSYILQNKMPEITAEADEEVVNFAQRSDFFKMFIYNNTYEVKKAGSSFIVVSSGKKTKIIPVPMDMKVKLSYREFNSEYVMIKEFSSKKKAEEFALSVMRKFQAV